MMALRPDDVLATACPILVEGFDIGFNEDSRLHGCLLIFKTLVPIGTSGTKRRCCCYANFNTSSMFLNTETGGSTCSAHFSISHLVPKLTAPSCY
jgi:hypothetical protein